MSSFEDNDTVISSDLQPDSSEYISESSVPETESLESRKKPEGSASSWSKLVIIIIMLLSLFLILLLVTLFIFYIYVTSACSVQKEEIPPSDATETFASPFTPLSFLDYEHSKDWLSGEHVTDKLSLFRYNPKEVEEKLQEGYVFYRVVLDAYCCPVGQIERTIGSLHLDDCSLLISDIIMQLPSKSGGEGIHWVSAILSNIASGNEFAESRCTEGEIVQFATRYYEPVEKFFNCHGKCKAPSFSEFSNQVPLELIKSRVLKTSPLYELSMEEFESLLQKEYEEVVVPKCLSFRLSHYDVYIAKNPSGMEVAADIYFHETWMAEYCKEIWDWKFRPDLDISLRCTSVPNDAVCRFNQIEGGLISSGTLMRSKQEWD